MEKFKMDDGKPIQQSVSKIIKFGCGVRYFYLAPIGIIDPGSNSTTSHMVTSDITTNSKPDLKIK